MSHPEPDPESCLRVSSNFLNEVTSLRCGHGGYLDAVVIHINTTHLHAQYYVSLDNLMVALLV